MKTKKAKKTAPKAKAAVSPKPVAEPPTVTLLKMPKADELRPGQALTILEILEKKGGELSLPDLLKAMEAKIVHQNQLGIKDVFFMVRPRLISEGFIAFKKGGRS